MSRFRRASGQRHGFGASEGATCAALFVLAAAVRWLFLRGTVDRDLPYSIFYYGDSRLYREFALAILDGRLFDQGIPYHPPLFAYVVAGVIAVVGENPGALRGLLAIAGSAAVPLTYLLGRRLWDRATALTGALLATFSFGLCVTAVSANTETIYVPMLVAQALLLVALGDALAPMGPGGSRGGARTASQGGGAGHRARRHAHDGLRDDRRAAALAAASGLVLGLGSLTRAEHLAFALILPIALVVGWPRSGFRRIAVSSAVMIGVAAIVIAPWTLRNGRVLRRFNTENPAFAEPLPTFVLVSNYGALNFALANREGSDGTFRPDAIAGSAGSRPRIDLRDPRQLALYLHGYRKGLADLAGSPGAALRLVARKLAIALEAGSLGFGLSDWPGGTTGTRRAVDLFTPASRIFLVPSLLLLAGGAWVLRGTWRRANVVVLIAAHKVLIGAAFFGYVRLFVTLLPFVYLVQSGALTALARRFAGPRGRRIYVVCGIALLALLAIELSWHAFSPRNFIASGSSDPATGKIIQDAAITLAPAPAARGAPR